MYAVVDIETTGNSAQSASITEIAIVITDGQRIINQFTSLINPQTHIPTFITNLTGITNSMVETAPTFSSLAPKILSFLDNHIFVAHNVNFDLSFITNQLLQEGYSYAPNKLCTVKYGRKIYPGLKSYSLGNLCRHFGMINNNAHRALDDTLVTVELLHKFLSLDTSAIWETLVYGKSNRLKLPINLPQHQYDNLPETTGVYYLLNQHKKPLYIGKAKNIKSRIKQHFSEDIHTKKFSDFNTQIAHVHVRETGNELLALLLEDKEIKHHWPAFNKAQKSTPIPYFIGAYTDQQNNWRLAITKKTRPVSFLAVLYSQLQAREYLFELVKTYNLAPELCKVNLPISDGTISHHNQTIATLINQQKSFPIDFVIWEKGPASTPYSFILVKQLQFYGYGFTHTASVESINIENTQLVEKISPISETLIRSYLVNNSDLSIDLYQFDNTLTLF